MVLNTFTVGASVTPTVIETYISHYLNRKPLREKPTAHISYHEGLELVRRFLHHASFHTVEEIQAFTSQWVPAPQWVKTEDIEIPKDKLSRAADLVCAQLGPSGVEAVGGKTWWQWRRDSAPLKAEWIEMRKDLHERKKSADPKGTRIMMYVHGGAYYFGSVDEHRYQMQRHARKLRARVIAPRYRLAPQFPFPCGLQDAVATYLHLLGEHDPSTILLAGDSAGGGMVLSTLVILRDQGIPLPAGAILLSPWVDLTHSFPSLGGDGKFDYIPAHGFVHKPSMAWPPPNSDDLKALEKGEIGPSKGVTVAPAEGEDKRDVRAAEKQDRQDRTRGYSVNRKDDPKAAAGNITTTAGSEPPIESQPQADGLLHIEIDGKIIEIKDQIQMYAANHLINHPLVSPVLQPSLGGLPPLLIQVGGGELLRDEQLYLAHKAAAPLQYVPAPNIHMTQEFIQSQFAKDRPTLVQLQVWDDLCHVAPTLSFTRPAKYMYRSIAQFGAWALARAQHTAIDIMDDDSISVISTSSDASSKDGGEDVQKATPVQGVPVVASAGHDPRPNAVGKAGDPLPPFEKHMIRQRIDRNGFIYPLASRSELPALQLQPSEIGVIKPGPVRKWMGAQQKWNKKFQRAKLSVQRKRLREMAKGYERFEGEKPPPTALAGRRLKGMASASKTKRGWGLSMWSGWGSKHDETTIESEKQADALPDISEENGTRSSKPSTPRAKSRSKSRGRPRLSKRLASHHSAVTDQGQAGPDSEATASASPKSPALDDFLSSMSAHSVAAAIPAVNVVPGTDTVVPDSNTLSTRPTREGVAYPFKLKLYKDGEGANASMVTLQSTLPSGTPGERSVRVSEDMVRAMDKEGGSEAGEKRSTDGKAERPQPEIFVTANEL